MKNITESKPSTKHTHNESELNSNTIYCSKCGNTITDDSNFCKKCGTKIKDEPEIKFCGKCGNKIYNNNPCSNCNLQYTQNNNPNPNYTRQRLPEWKSEGTTLVLTIVLGILGLGGIGHIYLGNITRGIGILIVGIILMAITVFSMGIGLIILIPFAIWVVFDARDKCRYYNDYLEQNGKSPW